jgi:hypothetical protein
MDAGAAAAVSAAKAAVPDDIIDAIPMAMGSILNLILTILFIENPSV